MSDVNAAAQSLPAGACLLCGDMQIEPGPSLETLRRFQVDQPNLVAETPIAQVFKVRVQGTGVAALKLYRRDDMANERLGVGFMKALDGQGCVRIYDQTENAVLMEWLNGPSLSDMARGGADDQAAKTLVDIAVQLHAHEHKDQRPLANLNDWFSPLFALKFSSQCPKPFANSMRHAQNLAKHLLSEMKELRPLHGDLHYGNVKRTTRGYVAFDAKGILGDPGYELANAFRHPADQADLVHNPVRINKIATLWAAGLEVPRERLLQWACAKCALSIAWRSGPSLTSDKEDKLLEALLNCAADA